MTTKTLLPVISRLFVLAAVVGLTACEVKKTEEGKMPEVEVKNGKMPEYDVQGPDVKVEQEKKTITVPDVDIVTPDEKRKGGNVEPGDAGAAAAPRE